MAEATIDELRIDIEADSAQAADGLDKLIQKLERLKSAVSGVTEGNGLNKLRTQINKLAQVAQQVQNLSGFDKITQLVNALKSLNDLSSVNTEQINAVTSSLRKLRNVVEQVNAMPAIDAAKLQQLSAALQPFSGANTQGFAEFLRSLQKLPKIAEKLDAMDFDRFAQQMERLAQAIGPVARELERAATAFERMPESTRQYISNASVTASATERVNSRTRTLNGTLATLKTRVLAAYAALAKLYSKLADCVNISNQFVENLNLFSVTMGESADEAYRFAEAVNEAMGIDASDWVRYQGFFQSIGKGFGIATEKADLMSQNLTQLSYDLSSFYNTSVDEAYNKVVSGISGELEPLRRYGFALDEATLKQVAYDKGITQSLETMTQAQKAQLRYIAIMEQAGNIGVLGDMSRTIDTSANSLRILSARLQQFARAVGNMLMPMLSAVLPYMTAFIQLLTEGAQHLAELFGFELPKIDLGANNITSGYDDIAAAANAATEATEEFKGSLAGVDQLNIIGSTSDSSGTGTGLNYDLNIDLPSYDFLNGVESKTKEIFENMKKWAMEALPWIEAVSVTLIGIFGSIALSKTWEFIEKLIPKIKKIGQALKVFFTGGASTAVKFTAGLAGGVANMLLWKNAVKQMTQQTDNWGVALGVAIGGTVLIGTALTAALGPVGLLITGIGGLVGACLGVNEAIEEQNRIITDNILYKNGGEKISEIADAFSEWEEAARAVNVQTIEKYQQLDTYNDQIGDTLNTIQEISGIELKLDEFTPADAEALKHPFEDLAGYLEGEFQERCAAAVNDLLSIFADMGISEVLSSQFKEAYDEMNRIIGESVGDANATVQKYLDIASSGGQLTYDQLQELRNDYNYVQDMARYKDVAYVDFDKAMDLSKIDLQDENATLTALEQLKSSYDAYVSSAYTRRDEAIANLDILQSQIDTAYKYGKIDTGEYEAQKSTLYETAQFADAYLKSELIEARSKYGDILTAVQSMYGQAAERVLPDVTQKLMALGAKPSALFDPDYSYFEEQSRIFAEADYLKNSKGYQLALKYESDMMKNNPYEIEIDSKSIAAQIMESENYLDAIQVPVNAYYGRNSQYKTELNNEDLYTPFRNGGIDIGKSGRADASDVLDKIVVELYPSFDVTMDEETVGEASLRHMARRQYVTNGE